MIIRCDIDVRGQFFPRIKNIDDNFSVIKNTFSLRNQLLYWNFLSLIKNNDLHAKNVFLSAQYLVIIEF